MQKQRNSRFETEHQRLQEDVDRMRSALASRDQELEELRQMRSNEQEAAMTRETELVQLCRAMSERHAALSSVQPTLSTSEEEPCSQQPSPELLNFGPDEEVQRGISLAETPTGKQPRRSSLSKARTCSPYSAPPSSQRPRERSSRRRSSSVESQSGRMQRRDRRTEASPVYRAHALPKRRASRGAAQHRSSSSTTPCQDSQGAGHVVHDAFAKSPSDLSGRAWLRDASPAASDDSIEIELRRKLRPLVRDGSFSDDDSSSPNLQAASASTEAELRSGRGVSSKGRLIPELTAAELKEVSGNFSLCIGAGSFGQVFGGKARLAEIDGSVAVKVPGPSATNTEAQFWRELRVAELTHPALMPLSAVCMELRALVYPRAAGTLEDRLRSVTSPGPTEGLDLLLGSAQGLLALHSRGFIHRDVKSSNIFVFAQDQGEGPSLAKLGDFGLVWEPPSKAPLSCATLVGTASYMDPDAIAAGCCSQRSDVFSFGVVMLEVLLRRSVTELPPGSRPLWRQLREALPLASSGVVASIAAVVAFACGAGASDCWNGKALEATAALILEATRESATQPGEVRRPDVAAIVERLQAAEQLQLFPPPVEETTPDEGMELRTCTICFENQIEARFRPCCHAVACEACAELFLDNECPVCRGAIESFDIGQFESTFVPV